jgi:hypothetical protein
LTSEKSKLSSGPYRVIEWSSDRQGGQGMLVAVPDHLPELQLVGVRVHSESKHGRSTE